ncbi:hypothetical protein Slin15195_G008530 [Septoria linicola]|uniref:Xylanolytic transcriptional activator regulatory domain-containing protein n=1 Tax=Septoria linicola TaxID=215465 RepID=A0A9Q9EF28_9PEZI|nr:hypothetical protein Slin14017_G008540 [Septoria linicola]USW47534.1 hypothetical protein Slin15195_G008530 [Septoria linicola]
MVEEKLRQAELRLRQAEQRARIAESKLQDSSQETSRHLNEAQFLHDEDNAKTPTQDSRAINQRGFYVTIEQVSRASAYQIEEPPARAEDFSWNEREAMQSPQSHGQSDQVYDSNVDGMASLSVEDKGAGYLGVASGAAMLKLLLPEPVARTHDEISLGSVGLNATSSAYHGWVPTPIFWERQIGMINLDEAIDAYFAVYQKAYPIVHEPTFRAQYARAIGRPDGDSWNALAYIVAAIGMFSTATCNTSQDLDLFEAAKSNISIASLESGNLTLVQTLSLMANYLQKRNQPNSGYNYLGLALHMALSLGLHKEFKNWHITPLEMEVRRRTWWTLFVFFSGAMVTFSRPPSWPTHGVEVALPTAGDDISAVSSQARFHLATNDIFARLISRDFPSATELLRLDDEQLECWRSSWSDISSAKSNDTELNRLIMELRYRNFRIIMYRFHLIKHMLHSSDIGDPATQQVIDRCLFEARNSIAAVHAYWSALGLGERHRMASWYCLYFIFQAALIPIICSRANPSSPQASEWGAQLHSVLSVIDSMKHNNPASLKCYQFIVRLCGDFLGINNAPAGGTYQPAQESPETQLPGLHGMLWPGAENDTFVPDDTWTTFLRDMASESPSEQTLGSYGIV